MRVSMRFRSEHARDAFMTSWWTTEVIAQTGSVGLQVWGAPSPRFLFSAEPQLLNTSHCSSKSANGDLFHMFSCRCNE